MSTLALGSTLSHHIDIFYFLSSVSDLGRQQSSFHYPAHPHNIRYLLFPTSVWTRRPLTPHFLLSHIHHFPIFSLRITSRNLRRKPESSVRVRCVSEARRAMRWPQRCGHSDGAHWLWQKPHRARQPRPRAADRARAAQTCVKAAACCKGSVYRVCFRGSDPCECTWCCCCCCCCCCYSDGHCCTEERSQLYHHE